MVGPDNNKNAEDEAPTVRLPETHTALFAPLGYPVEATYGIKSVKPVMPPREASDQVNWSEKQPNVYELDNQSLVAEFLMLDDCFADGYIKTLTPAHWRYDEIVKGELWARVGALNKMVEQYNEAKEEYGADTYQWVINGIHNKIASVLDSREYKTLIRSSLTPLFTLKDKWISDETKAYFNAHGGYENAHKANWTVWDPQPNKKSITTSASGQTGKVIEEVGAGATVDIEGVLYVLHNSNNGGASHAFISEVAKTAVAGKNIVIPDYVTYNGKKYPVTEMRGNIFSGTAIKSVKLPSTLTEISNSAFRETPITEIVIPASVKIVQGSAFYGCKNLTKVVFENDVMDEVHGCFQKCINLKNVKFPRRVGHELRYVRGLRQSHRSDASGESERNLFIHVQWLQEPQECGYPGERDQGRQQRILGQRHHLARPLQCQGIRRVLLLRMQSAQDCQAELQPEGEFPYGDLSRIHGMSVTGSQVHKQRICLPGRVHLRRRQQVES